MQVNTALTKSLCKQQLWLLIKMGHSPLCISALLCRVFIYSSVSQEICSPVLEF